MAKRRLDDVEESLERSRKLADAQSDENREAMRRLQEEKDDLDRQVDQLRRNIRGKFQLLPNFQMGISTVLTIVAIGKSNC